MSKEESVKVELIYCADGNRRFAEIAIAAGFTYGAQLPNTIYFHPGFIDQNWKHPNRLKYIAALEQHRPDLATVLDWEYPDQLEEVLSWATQASQYASTIIIIPKVIGGIASLPRFINNKPVRLGYSASSQFSGTSVPTWEFNDWPVHCLGGSPKTALMLGQYLNIRSADGNYLQRVARQYGKFYTRQGYRYLREIGPAHVPDGMYTAFNLSCQEYYAEWNGG